MSVKELEGWHTRALVHPHPDPHSFVPRRVDLEMAMLTSTMAEPSGFTLAIFSSKDNDNDQYVVVDALGRVLLLPGTPTDIQGLLDLGRQVSDLPPTGALRNTWCIYHDVTCRPIHELLVAVDSSERLDHRELKQTSVYGYSKNSTKLTVKVNEYTHLPNVIQDTFGLLIEAGEGYQGTRGSGDRFIIDKVKKLWEI